MLNDSQLCGILALSEVPERIFRKTTHCLLISHSDALQSNNKESVASVVNHSPKDVCVIVRYLKVRASSLIILGYPEGSIIMQLFSLLITAEKNSSLSLVCLACCPPFPAVLILQFLTVSRPRRRFVDTVCNVIYLLT